MGESGKQGVAPRSVARQKAQKAVRQWRQTRCGKGRYRRGGAGQGGDRQAFLAAGAHKAVAGVGQKRRARVGNKGHILAFAQGPQHMFLPLGLVVVVETQKAARLNAAVAKKAGRAARVFRKHEVGLG